MPSQLFGAQGWIPTGINLSIVQAAAANPVLMFLVQLWRDPRAGSRAGGCEQVLQPGLLHSWIWGNLLWMKPWEKPSPAAGQELPSEWEQVNILPSPQNCIAPAEPPHLCCHCSSVPKWGILLFKIAEHPEILTHHSGSSGISGLENEVICLFSWNSISGAVLKCLSEILFFLLECV